MLRLSGGKFRGRMIQVPASPGKVRPTKAMLRQALFNSIQAVTPGARVLDLFAGSGSLGLEALSRGAAEVVAVESLRPSLQCIQSNVKALAVEAEYRLLSMPVERSWNELRRLGPFDLVLADPPYADGWELRLLEEAPWGELLAEEGLVVLEWGVLKSRMEKLPDETPNLVKIREKLYGDSGLTTYRKKGE
jgi:16S rRNA (guanine966-N2)-methyltransferase